MKRQRPVRLWAAAFWLLVWEGASLALASTTGGRMLLLASPVQALGRLIALAATAEFWQAAAFSSLRILGGFFLSCVLAVALAALAARLRWVRELLSPLVAVVKAVPVVSFIILALDELSTICVILMAVNGLMVIYYAARPLDLKRIILLAAMTTAMFVAVVFYGEIFSLTALSFAAWLVLIVLVLLVVPIQMGLEWCFDRCSAALERRRERREKRRRSTARRSRPERRPRRR